MTGNLTGDPIGERGAPALSILLSIALHAIVIFGTLFFYNWDSARTIVAAGAGEGGEGGGGAIEVGVTDTSAILGFARPQPVSHIGDQDSSINNARVETARPQESADEVLPSTERDAPNPDSVKTDRPVVNQQERIFTGKEERGRSQSQTAQVGRTFGSPTPAMIGGVGIGSGGGFGGGTGLPGGSEYGRRIQSILSRHFNPPAVDAEGVQYVIIILRIARDGRVLSVSGGRLAPSYFKQRSPMAQINYAAERAVLASNPLPPMPDGFLMSAQEVTAEVWFRYPK
ncbi:MAG TPA: TonB C-terminal domain-containing protein [Blastocatellia bacterium]|nr:TonB C-terminal domain-containing protein [Blastocatellia bacterium]